MLGLTLDKLVVIGIIVAILVGPQRLPLYVQRTLETVRAMRTFLETARTQAEERTGVSRQQWQSLDIRHYDPRRILRDALDETADGSRAGASAESADPLPEEREKGTTAQQKPAFIIAGSSGHPRRIPVTRQTDQGTAAETAGAAEQNQEAAPLSPAARGRTQRQGDGEPSLSDITDEIDLPAVGGEDRLDDRHAQSGSPGDA